METDSASLTAWSYGSAALSYGLLGAYLVSLGAKWRSGKVATTMLVATGISALWSLLSFGSALTANKAITFVVPIFDLFRQGAWYVFLVLLLTPENTESRASPQLPAWLLPACWISVLTGLALQISFMNGWLASEQWLRLSLFQILAMPVIGLILVEQLFRAASEDSVWNIKPLCLGLAGQFAFDIYLSSDAMMFNHVDEAAFTVRGFIHVITLPLLFLACIRSRNWTSKVRLSQKAAFHSATLLIAGAYLMFMAAVGYYVRYFGGEWGRVLQLALLCAAILGLGALIVSASMRAKMRVLVGKHFFNYRYDYREEWLRFTQTLSTQDSPQARRQQ